jgi:hypothetical protein
VDCQRVEKVQKTAPIAVEPEFIVSLELRWKGPVT